MKKYFAVFLTISIPALLFLIIWQSSRYAFAVKTMNDYDFEQKKIIMENKRKIAGIYVLAKSERVENIAQKKLGMKKAQTQDILRIKIEKGASDE